MPVELAVIIRCSDGRRARGGDQTGSAMDAAGATATVATNGGGGHHRGGGGGRRHHCGGGDGEVTDASRWFDLVMPRRCPRTARPSTPPPPKTRRRRAPEVVSFAAAAAAGATIALRVMVIIIAKNDTRSSRLERTVHARCRSVRMTKGSVSVHLFLHPSSGTRKKKKKTRAADGRAWFGHVAAPGASRGFGPLSPHFVSWLENSAPSSWMSYSTVVYPGAT